MLTICLLLCGLADTVSPEEFASFLAAKVTKWHKVVDDAGIKGQ